MAGKAEEGWTTERISRAFFAGIAIAIAVIGVIGFVSVRSAITSNHWVEHTLEIQKSLAALETSALDAGAEYREFVNLGDVASLDRLQAENAESKEHVLRLAELTQGDEQQQRRIAELSAALDRRIAFGTELVTARQQHGPDAALKLLDSGESARRMRPVRVIVDAMNDEEDVLLRERTGHATANIQEATLIGGAFTIVMLVAMAVGYVFIRNYGRARRAAFKLLQQSEDRIRSVVDGVRDHAMYMLDSGGNIASWNAGAERLFGYSEATIIGKHISIFDKANTSELDRQLALAVEQGRHEEIGARFRADGTSLWADTIMTPLVDQDGAVRGFAIVTRDLTEQREGEAALARAEDQLRQAQKLEAIGSLAGGIAHDFNNLLSVILSYTEIIVSELAPDDPMRADLEEVNKAGLRAAQLTRQLLAFGRRQVLQPKAVDLNAIVEGSETMLRRLLNADIELSLLTSTGLGSVFADPAQLDQVVMNLVVNARDAMPTGGKLSIETTNVDLGADHVGVTPGRYVMLAVTDTGTGMDRATQDRLFEPFFTTKDVGKGTGLGLSTVFGIVKQSGGHIWVYSELGHGTTFKVYFPRSDARPELAIAASVDDVRGTATLLLVEDEEQVRTVARSILRGRGYNVLEARNSGEALLICENYPARIDLLLTDVVMPLMSGRQLAERLAPLRREMKVLYMSGYTDDSIVHHGVLDAGIAFLQ